MFVLKSQSFVASDNQGLTLVSNFVVKATVNQTRYQRGSKFHSHQPVWNVLPKQPLYNSDIVCNENAQDDNSVLPKDLIFTCYTKDNQQGCFRLSNWFPLRRLGPWKNHLPPAW